MSRFIEQQLARSHETLAEEFALSEFAARWNTDDPLQAMQTACENLVQQYRETVPSSSSVLGVAHFCRLLDVSLAGEAKAVSSALTVSSAGYRHRHAVGSARIELRRDRPRIVFSANLPRDQARVAIAHELGHCLIHQTPNGVDPKTSSMPTSVAEEALAELAARLLLMPKPLPADAGVGTTEIRLDDAESSFQLDLFPNESILLECLREACTRNVTLYAAAARLGDLDRPNHRVRGAILWGMDSRKRRNSPTHERLTPLWHHCGPAFVPVRRSCARQGSVVDEAASLGSTNAILDQAEDVAIGSFRGRYRVEAFAWGSLNHGTRKVLSLFYSI